MSDDLRLYRQMVRARRFEERVYKLFIEGLVSGSTHLAVGQEAVAVGTVEALRPDDPVFCTYRGHHVLVARDAPTEALLAEIAGRRLGINKGKGGSMHLTSVEHGCYGAYAIVGAHLGIAVGAAYAAQVLGSGQVAVAFFGDGATNNGAFHESLNLAAVWRLPCLFVCENNRYAEYSAARDQALVAHPAADRAGAYGIPGEVLDGNDVKAVHAATAAAAVRARAGEGPTVLECLTYRHLGHSRDDPATYRPEDEVQEWLARDPIPRLAASLREAGVGQEALDAVEREAQGELDRAEEAARSADPPDPAELLTDVWASEGVAWRS